MKFTLLSNISFGRLGVISNVTRLKDFEMATPNVLLCTASGTVPHLTFEVLEMVTKQKLGLSIPVQNVSQIQEQLKSYPHTIAEYIGMKEYLTYLSFINPNEERSNDCHLTESVALWTRNGRKTFTAETYMELVQSFKPDLFLLLADGGTNPNSSVKGTKKSFENSLSLFEKCLEMYKNSDSLKSCQTLGAIEGGYDLALREKSSKLIGESSAFGVVIDGLHDSCKIALELSILKIKSAVEASLKYIPDDKLRIIHGCYNPSVVLDLIELGIDLVDSSYVIYVTEQKGAFIFPNTFDFSNQYNCNGVTDKNIFELKNSSSKILQSTEDEPVPKKPKISEPKFYMSLLDSCYTTDFTPINPNCSCLACKSYTKAYIHHLLKVKELLGDTLLMIHNLHHYLVFISAVREALKNGKFLEFKKYFHKVLND